ncbi:MAG: helix-turn-helix transcriptional regulator [Anaerovibrio sp.]|uniref:helix-turn-helix domain-containing protein n=1 Tax=Anaerovibrio sp. TaxID=1872532 RepID=UPI001B184F8D|nr:helix-turn-helix transcriptional regulator [Anaerovibrio sp.]MBO6245261.1 helix-turn-helix transcriptional regulator [Anaerovibrio sp.]
MNKVMASSSEIHDILNQDEEFKIEYDRLKPRYDLIAQIINARHEQKITQAEMAKRMGTNKSNISRFESGSYNPSLDFLIHAAASLGKKIEFSLQ